MVNYYLCPSIVRLVLWYNADALKAAGASVPTTWDEVEAAAKLSR